MYGWMLILDGLKCISGTEWTLSVTWMWFAFKTAFLKFFSITTEPEIIPHNLGYLFLASIFFVSGMWWFGLSLTFIIVRSRPSVCLYVDDYGNVAYVNFSIPVGRYIHTYMEWMFHFGFRIRWLAKTLYEKRCFIYFHRILNF